jgi:hypothetical protein
LVKKAENEFSSKMVRNGVVIGQISGKSVFLTHFFFFASLEFITFHFECG